MLCQQRGNEGGILLVAEEKRKFCRRSLFRIKIEIVYIYIVEGGDAQLGVNGIALRGLFRTFSQEEWMYGWIDEEGRENRDNGGLKRGSLQDVSQIHFCYILRLALFHVYLRMFSKKIPEKDFTLRGINFPPLSK